jgi:hypothetical protein
MQLQRIWGFEGGRKRASLEATAGEQGLQCPKVFQAFPTKGLQKKYNFKFGHPVYLAVPWDSVLLTVFLSQGEEVPV